MNNIFKNAYFGKPYKTRDERKAIFYNHHNAYAREGAKYVTMILEGKESIYRWNYDGKAMDSQEHLDIISEWKYSIDEDRLNRFAENWCPESGSYREGDIETQKVIRNACKAGYRQGWEDKI